MWSARLGGALSPMSCCVNVSHECFSKAKVDELLYLVVAAFSWFPCETFLVEVMADDLLLRRSAELRDVLQEDVSFVSDLPEYVWGRIATLVYPDLEAGELRPLVLEASHRSAGYVYKEVVVVCDS